MSEDKKKVNANEDNTKEMEKKEISLDELDEVIGGALANVRYTKTNDISSDTKDKI